LECGAPLKASASEESAEILPEDATTELAEAASQTEPEGGDESPKDAESEPVDAKTEEAESISSAVLKSRSLSIRSAVHHVRGLVKENDQDFVQKHDVDYPLHGFKISILAGADGIGGAASGERWAHATVSLFMGGMGVHLPGFDDQEKHVDREQFWELLKSKVHTYFYPTINWVTQCIYAFGDQTMKGKYGCTFSASVTISDLQNSRAITYIYSVGDSSTFLITSEGIEKLTTDHSSASGALKKYVGYKQPSANGDVIVREFEFNSSFPYATLVHCSDGLTNMLSPEVIREVCETHSNPLMAVCSLIRRALTVEIPFGFSSDAEVPVTTGDDNILVGILCLKGKVRNNEFSEKNSSDSDEPADPLTQNENGSTS
jgi:serine/threonine protein phosphatase PrpC